MSETTQDMQIFSIIEQLETLVENSQKPKLGGGNKRIIEADDVFDLLGDLKVTIPDDIRRANSVIVDAQNISDNADDYARDVVEKAEQDADRIVADADAQANEIIERAKAEYERLISENEVFKEAQRRAQLLAAKAEYNANCVYENAKVYADEVLVDLQRFLREYEQQVQVNRSDLGARAQQPQQAAAEPVKSPAVAEKTVAPAEEYGEERRERRRPARKPEPVRQAEAYDDDDDDFYEDEDEDEPHEKGSFLGLFKKKKRPVEDDDFLDEDM